MDRRCDYRCGRVGTHAACVGTVIALVEALVVLTARERQYLLAIGHDDEARFLALQEFLDHNLGAGIAEAAAKHLACRGISLLEALGDHDTLAGGQAAGLDDDRRTLGAQPGAVVIVLGEAAVGRAWNTVPLQEVLGKCLRAFQARGQSARAKARQPASSERIDDAGHQRRLRTNDGQVHALAACELEKARNIGGRDRDVAPARLRGGAGIARRGELLAHARRLGTFPGQRMLAPAAADDQDFQWRKCLTPVSTMAMPCSSAAAMTSSSRLDPPG